LIKQHEMKINLPGLLKMLSSNIYADPNVAVREMIQNAHDTCIIRIAKDKRFSQPRIDISYDKKQKTLTFSDNGTGMTQEELHKYLSTIGEGVTRLQRQKLQGTDDQKALLLIGQFGIGLLSAFSIANKVEVFTCSCQANSSGFKWTCEGDIHYTVKPIDKTAIGTRLVLHLSDSNLSILDDMRLLQAVKKYADFLSVPIYLKGNQVNICIPPWEKDNSQIDYSDYIQARYNLYPLAFLPFQLSEPLHLDGLLFVPMISYELTRDFGEVDIYISRMFIKSNDKELLPSWARFIKGVINTSALTPTVSRDEVVRDENYLTIRDMLGETILNYLACLEEHSPEILDSLVGIYNNTIKARAMDDDVFFDRICSLVRFSTDTGPMSMKEYLSKSHDVIYYFTDRGTGTQHKLLFAYKGLPVIDASWGMEEEFLEKYAKRMGIKIERLEAGTGIIFKTPESVDERWQALEKQFKTKINKEAKAVAFEPSTVPAVLVAKPIDRGKKELEHIETLGQDLGMRSAQISKMFFERMSKSRAKLVAGETTILQLNTTNPLMQQLRDMNRNETFRLALTTIYYNAKMFAQHYISADNAEIIFTTTNSTISEMIGNARALEELQVINTRMQIELSELRRRTPPVALSKYRTCFFAYPFQDKFHALRNKIKDILARDYGIKLMTTAIEIKDANIVEDIKKQIAEAHFGIADITGNNPNVLWELGLMIGYGKPVIILKDKSDKMTTPFDLYGNYCVRYQIAKDDTSGFIEFALLANGLELNLKRVFSQFPELKLATQYGKNEEAR